ncbi:MAG TPA: efflux RND transporter periplasmic adaptor subunit, partial [Polyangiaceae bacterium]|nr:efflux RND transporter periplasmic adaptor subunit [Polyangiaceae bacterium]
MSIDSSEDLASTTEEPRSTQPPPAARPSRKRAALIAVPLLLGAVGVFFWQRDGEAAIDTQAEPAPDVPRVQGDQIRFSDNFAKRAGIKIAKVRFDQLVPVVSAVGTVDFNAEHVAAIGTRLRGLVSRVTKFEGDPVKAGTVLARVESAELGEAQAAVSMLDAERHAAELNA